MCRMTGLLFALLCLGLEAHQATAQEVFVDTNPVVSVTLNMSLTDQQVLEAAVQGVCMRMKNGTLTQVDKSFCTVYKDCRAVYDAGSQTSGVYSIRPDGLDEMQVYCEFDDCGPWIVIQRRIDGMVDFQRYWLDYKNGFGDLEGEHWLGLEKLYKLTNKGYNNLKVVLANGTDTAYAAYSSFIVKDASPSYTLAVGGYSGTAGDSLSVSDGEKFSIPSITASSIGIGAWWFPSNGTKYCDPNGPYGSSHFVNGIFWYTWKGMNHLPTVTIKIKMY